MSTTTVKKHNLTREPLTPEQELEYKRAFFLFDRDDDGLISAKDLSLIVRSVECNPSDGQIERLISQTVNEGTNLIDCSQFLTIMSVLKKAQDLDARKELREIFNGIDTDSNGLIDRIELRNFMRLLFAGPDDLKLSEEEIDQMIAEIDSDKDGRLTFDDFATLFCRQA